MRRNVLRFLSTDGGRIAALATVILILALGGVALSRIVSGNMLRADAQSTSGTWAHTLIDRLGEDLPAVAAGSAPSARTLHLLEGASHIGDIYRFRIWSKTGQLVFTSERMPSRNAPQPIAQRFGQEAAAKILSGTPFTQAETGTAPENPEYFADSFVPLVRNGALYGSVEVFLDQTADRILYQQSFLLTESIIAIAVLLAGGLPAFMVYRKMLEHRAAQAEAQFLADHDSLTGIANRKRLEESATGALAWNRRAKTFVAVLLLDLDRFKDINDSFGHAAGDDVLRAFVRRVKDTIRAEDMVARFGGDEFVVLQVGMAQPAGATTLAERLLKALAEPYDVGGLKLASGACIGVAVAPTDAKEWDSLLSCADAALYKAKAEGRNSVCFFEAGMDESLRKRRQIEFDMRRALETNAFQLAYQPLFRFDNHALLGFEALLRWPQGWEPQTPDVFIPIAEESTLMVSIGAWVIQNACKTAASWTKPLKVSVNLSPVQFRYGNIVAVVKSALQTSGLDPARLELEVTESLWIQNTDTVFQQLMSLRAMGIQIALDDFGTGYSSLTYLWKFPFDRVKIDRSFVMEMESDQKAEAIVKTIIALSKTLNLSVTAEGVETPAQAQALILAGCDQAQGFLFGRPLPPALASALIEAEPPPALHAEGQAHE